MKNNLTTFKKILITALIIFGVWFLVGKSMAVTPYDLYIPYCTTQGGTVNGDKCEFSDKKCSLEDFYYGKDCQEHDYCTLHGFQVIYMDNLNMGSWTARMPVCQDAKNKQCVRDDVINGKCQTTDCYSETVGLDHFDFGTYLLKQSSPSTTSAPTQGDSPVSIQAQVSSEPSAASTTASALASSAQIPATTSQTQVNRPSTTQAVESKTTETPNKDFDFGNFFSKDKSNPITQKSSNKNQLVMLIISLIFLILVIALTLYILLKKRSKK